MGATLLNTATPSRFDLQDRTTRTDSAPVQGAGLRVRILIVGEKGVMRDALCALFALTADVEIAGSASVGPEALHAVAQFLPDVIVTDLPPSTTRGMELLASMKAEWPDVRIVVLTFHCEDRMINAARDAGADGYVLKSSSSRDLYAAVISAAAGKGFVGPSVREPVPSASEAERQPARTASGLSRRELQVIRLITAGQRTREIAKLLSLSHKTIEKHRANLMRKLGLRNASAAAAYATANGLTDD